MMTEFLEITIDKFTFKVAADRWYTREGVWASATGHQVRIGLSDFLQQRSGDVAFAEIKPAGTQLTTGDEVAAIETIKVNVALSSPVSGKLIEINVELETAPEVINQDPYGAGWLGVIEAADWETDRSQLLDAAAYLQVIRRAAEGELP